MNNLTLYKKRIFEYFRDTRFNKTPEQYTVCACATGEQCADECRMYALLNNGLVEQIAFQVNGCILATACANMLAEALQHQKIDALQNMTQESFLEKIVQIPIEPARLGCVLLAFNLCKNRLKA